MVSVLEPRPCGECTLCCKLFPLPEMGKAAGQWCQHVLTGAGCAIHQAKPQPCRTFLCSWTMAEGLDERWRPDTAGFVLATQDNDKLYVQVDPDRPDAWRREPYYSHLKSVASRARSPYLMVLVRTAGRLTMIFPEADIDLGVEPEGLRIDSGYELVDGRRRA